MDDDPAGPTYPKIDTAFKRDQENHNVIMPGRWSQPEFKFLQDVPWRWTEKIDGTNTRLHWDGEKVTLGGRTRDAQIPARFLQAVEKYMEPGPWSSEFGAETATVYGEGYGAKIQKGGGNYIPDGQDFIVFDVRIGRWWLKDDDVASIAAKLGMRVVPMAAGMEFTSLRTAVQLLEDGELESHWPGVSPEGIVGKPAIDLLTRGGQRIITKLKAKDFADLERWR